MFGLEDKINYFRPYLVFPSAFLLLTDFVHLALSTLSLVLTLVFQTYHERKLEFDTRDIVSGSFQKQTDLTGKEQLLRKEKIYAALRFHELRSSRVVYARLGRLRILRGRGQFSPSGAQLKHQSRLTNFMAR